MFLLDQLSSLPCQLRHYIGAPNYLLFLYRLLFLSLFLLSRCLFCITGEDELDVVLEGVNAELRDDLLELFLLLLDRVLELAREGMRLLRGLPELRDQLVRLLRLWREKL